MVTEPHFDTAGVGPKGAGPVAGMFQQVMDLLLQGPPNPDRFPALPVVMRDIAKAATRALTAQLGSEVTFAFTASTMAATEELVADLGGSGVTGIVEAEAWQARVLLYADTAFAGVIATVSAGGAGGPAPMPHDPPRQITTIDVNLVKGVFDTLLPVLEEALEPVAATRLALVRAAARVKPDVLAARGRDLIVSRFDIVSAYGAGVFLLALPWTVLADLGEAFTQGPREKPRAQDAGWSRQMGQEIVRAEVTLNAVLGRMALNLGDVARLAPGQLVVLDPPRSGAGPQGAVRIDCDGEALFLAELGQAHGAYVLRITDFINEEQEFLDGLLPG